MQLDLFENGTPTPASVDDAQSVKQIKCIRSRRCPLPPFRKNAPKGTSEVAAAMIAPNTNSMRERVYRAIIGSGVTGLTDDEGEAQLGIIAQSYTPRRRELVQLGCIRDSGNRRMTRNGRTTAVWIAVSKRGVCDE